MVKIAIDSSIFRDYDIRGIYPKQINEETYYILGRAIASFLKINKVALGFDMRLSSLSLYEALSKGLVDQGVDVVNLGMISTEMNYFASGYYNFPANIIISASHNPAEYNGLKIVKKGVVPLHGGYGLPQIKKLAISQNFTEPGKKGVILPQSIMSDWIDHVLKFVDVKALKPLKVVIDAGNGMGGISWQELYHRLPVKIIPLYFEPDGHFPHHLPDPIKEFNLVDLKKEILTQKADLGFALDGDADRLFILDEKGMILSGTITTAILSSALLEKYGPNIILYNTVCGKIVPETVKKMGGNPIRVRVGHSFIKEYMKKENALFAGEHSGHFYFRDNYYADSSLIAGLIFLEYLSKLDLTLSYVVQNYKKYYSSGEINFKVQSSDDILSCLEKDFSSGIIDHIDGLSVWYDNWWFNLRASKTEPYVRLNVEADSKEILDAQFRKLENLITSLGGKRV